MSHSGIIIGKNLKDISNTFDGVGEEVDALNDKVIEADNYLKEAVGDVTEIHEKLEEIQTETTNILANPSNFTGNQVCEVLEDFTDDLDRLLP